MNKLMKFLKAYIISLMIGIAATGLIFAYIVFVHTAALWAIICFDLVVFGVLAFQIKDWV